MKSTTKAVEALAPMFATFSFPLSLKGLVHDNAHV